MNKRQIRFMVGMYYLLLAQKPTPKQTAAKPKITKAKSPAEPAIKPAADKRRWIMQGRKTRLRFVLVAIAALVLLIIVVNAQPHRTTPAKLAAPAPDKAAAKPNPAPPKPLAAAATTLNPLSDKTICPHGSVLTTVAHQDDDILFMNPALQQSIADGWCLRTVFVTAGDDGNDGSYWQAREQGPLDAYATMFNTTNQWTSQTVSLNGHQLVAYSLEGVPRVSLLFLRLPDGNLDGQGFGRSGYQSLRKLRSGSLASIASLDGTSSYSRPDLINTLRRLINLDQPKAINTQAFSAGLAIGDHSDHQAVGYFTTLAAAGAKQQPVIHRFIGYQAGSMAPNLTDDQIEAKLNVFAAYEQHDSMVCNGAAGCFNDFVYLRYISRQYEQVNPGL